MMTVQLPSTYIQAREGNTLQTWDQQCAHTAYLPEHNTNMAPLNDSS